MVSQAYKVWALQGHGRLHQAFRETLKQGKGLEESQSLQRGQERPGCGTVEVKPKLQLRQQHVGEMRTMTYRLSRAETPSEVSPMEKCWGWQKLLGRALRVHWSSVTALTTLGCWTHSWRVWHLVCWVWALLWSGLTVLPSLAFETRMLALCSYKLGVWELVLILQDPAARGLPWASGEKLAAGSIRNPDTSRRTQYILHQEMAMSFWGQGV